MFKHTLINQIIEKYQQIWALNHLSAIASWDIETFMPSSGIYERSRALSHTAVLVQKLFLQKDFVKLIREAQALDPKDLLDSEKGVIRSLVRSLDQYQKLPSKFVNDWQEITNQAQMVWREAKLKNDFSIFQPELTKIFDLCRQKAELIGYEGNPYDVMLDDFEEGITTKQLDPYFDDVKSFVKPFVHKITKSSLYKPSHILETEKFDRKKIKKISQKMLQYLYPDTTRIRLDTSSHPFTQGISGNDVRITVWDKQDNFASVFLALIHEFGHALYDLQSGEHLYFSPIHGGSSLAIHESQSRFWENFVGRSDHFIDLFWPEISSLIPENYTKQDVYSYFNLIKPDLIRVNADEITYHLHIAIRYELEKAMINKEIEVADLPDAWSKKYHDYLGIKPQTFSEGVLQDIHWSIGAIGYFPTYSLGTVFSATIREKFEAEHGNLDQLINEHRDISKIQSWLKDNIHYHGSTYTFNQLNENLAGQLLSTDPWKKYLTKKYSKIYGL